MATPAKSRRFRYIATASAGLALSCPLGTPPTIADIVVEFPGTTAANPPLLLYSGREGANCPEFEPHVANPTVTLDDVYGQQASQSMLIVPVCPDPDPTGRCLCECDQSYVVGGSCP